VSEKVAYLAPAFVETLPPRLESGLLYVSLEYNTTAHLCCCGCGEEVIAPLSPAQWSLSYDGRTVSLSPSIGNWSLPCESHYWIRNGRIDWSYRFTPHQISVTRKRDHHAVAADAAQGSGSWLTRNWRRFLQFFSRTD